MILLALLQHVAADSAPAAPIDARVAVDSAVVVSPLPGGAAAAFRWFFNRPQWLQIGGLVVGLVVAAAVIVLAWRHREAILGWFRSRSRAWKVGFASALAVVAIGAVGFAGWSWNYMQHDNDFCVSCHVMTPAFSRFQTSEHRKLECHDCHRQSVFASAQELYYWVAERPEKIPPHAPVPTRICAECHIQDRPDSAWQRISATAGHRVHLESDSSALEKVQCVTCHGQEIHRFVPADTTCAQSGCHVDVEIKLGKMRNQTALHCAGCHQFTRPVSETVAIDTARAGLVPQQNECFACHEMREAMKGFDALLDPHEGSCGACHNPHEQETPAAAFESCATSGCHARPDTLTPFHRGIPEAALAKCGDCHVAHEWTVGETTCLTCHEGILRDEGGTRPPAARRAAGAPLPAPHALPGVRTRELSSRATLRPIALQRQGQPAPAVARAVTENFSHRRHRDVSCKSCHSMERTHGELTVRTERDCQACHHPAQPAQAGQAARECSACHSAAEIGATRRPSQQLRLSVWKEARTRPLPFDHDQHRAVRCADCHVQPLTLAVQRTCASCHAQHHEPTVTCTACHVPPKEAHTRAAHLGCAGAGCHETRTVATLQATRATCLTCHVDMARHRPGRECAACHQVNWRPGAVRTAE